MIFNLKISRHLSFDFKTRLVKIRRISLGINFPQNKTFEMIIAYPRKSHLIFKITLNKQIY